MRDHAERGNEINQHRRCPANEQVRHWGPSGQDQKKAEKKKDIIIGSFYGGGIVFFLDETGEH
jgi:hypothetical protein